MNAHSARLPLINNPAVHAATMPDTTLIGEKERLVKNPITPPSPVAIAPRYGPRIIPNTGAATDAKAMAFPEIPIMGVMGTSESTEYMAPKQIVNAICLVVHSLFRFKFSVFPCFVGNLIIV